MGSRAVIYAAIAGPIGFVVGAAVGFVIDIMVGSYNPHYLGNIGSGLFEVAFGLGGAWGAADFGWELGKRSDARAAERQRGTTYQQRGAQQPAYQQDNYNSWLRELNPPR